MLPVLLLLLLLECHSFASNHQHAITRCGCAFRTTRTTHTRDCIGQLNRMCVRVRVCYGWENHKICKRALHTREREQRVCQIRVSMVWHIKNITFPPEWQLHPAVGEREMGERGRVKGKRNKKSIAWRGVQCAINKTEWRSNKNRSLTSQPKTHFCTHAFSTILPLPPSSHLVPLNKAYHRFRVGAICFPAQSMYEAAYFLGLPCAVGAL